MNNTQDSWNNLGGDDAIDFFKQTWQEWSVDDTIKWFKLALNGINASSDDDYEIEDCSSDSSYDETDDRKQQILLSNHDPIDFNDIKSQLLILGFKAKREIPVLLKPFQFERFGFKNKKDCKLLCKKTKLLIKKYPKIKAKISKTHNCCRTTEKNNKNGPGLEGFVEDTNIN